MEMSSRRGLVSEVKLEAGAIRSSGEELIVC
jgi:hypothetical protein